MRITANKILAAVLAAAMVAIVSAGASAATITLGAATGDVQVRATLDGDWVPGIQGMELGINAAVKTGPNGNTSLEWGEGSVVKIFPLTIINVDELAQENKPETTIALSMEQGRSLTRIEKLAGADSSKFELRTPTAVAGVRGTVFDTVISADLKSVTFAVVEGVVSVIAGAVEITLEAGFESIVGAGEPPIEPQAISPEKRVLLDQESKDMKSSGAPAGEQSEKKDEKKDDKAAQKDEKKDEKAESKEEKKDEKKKEDQKSGTKATAGAKAPDAQAPASMPDDVDDMIDTVSDQNIESITINNEITDVAEQVQDSCTSGACVGGTFSF